MRSYRNSSSLVTTALLTFTNIVGLLHYIHKRQQHKLSRKLLHVAVSHLSCWINQLRGDIGTDAPRRFLAFSITFTRVRRLGSLGPHLQWTDTMNSVKCDNYILILVILRLAVDMKFPFYIHRCLTCVGPYYVPTEFPQSTAGARASIPRPGRRHSLIKLLHKNRWK